MPIILKDTVEIPQVSKQIRNLWYIADSPTVAVRTGIDDISGFDPLLSV